MPKTIPQPDPEDAHKDLMATLAASRELGPEMDRALAESYMQKHQATTPAPVSQNQQVDLPSRFNSSDLASAIVMVAGIAAFATLFILKGPEAFGLLWFFFLFGGWRFFGWSRRNADYYQRRREYRDAHREMRDDWRAMRRGYYRIADPDRPSLPTPTVPNEPPVSVPTVSTPPAAQVPQPPVAAPLPPVAPATPPSPTPSAGSAVPPVNPAG